MPVESVIHLFRAERPGQSRGVPEITPALPLFAMLRRYTLAVLGAAEQAALPSGVIYTDAQEDAPREWNQLVSHQNKNSLPVSAFSNGPKRRIGHPSQ
jgi:capsid protein